MRRLAGRRLNPPSTQGQTHHRLRGYPKRADGALQWSLRRVETGIGRSSAPRGHLLHRLSGFAAGRHRARGIAARVRFAGAKRAYSLR
jgi:hypothetical protein